MLRAAASAGLRLRACGLPGAAPQLQAASRQGSMRRCNGAPLSGARFMSSGGSSSDAPVYVVFGAGGGIGSALIRRLAAQGPQQGGHVVAVGHRMEQAEPLAEELGPQVHAMAADAVDPHQHAATSWTGRWWAEQAMSAAKAGVEGLARSAAAGYAQRGVRVNCVAPGLTRTRQTQSLTQPGSPQEAASKAMHPMKQLAEPQHIASALAFFMSPENDFITGQVLAVDGGLTTLHPHHPSEYAVYHSR